MGEYVYTVAVLTTSDKCSKGEREDKSGKIVRDLAQKIPGKVVQYDLIPDEPELIKEKLIDYTDNFHDFLYPSTIIGLQYIYIDIHKPLQNLLTLLFDSCTINLLITLGVLYARIFFRQHVFVIHSTRHPSCSRNT